MQKRQCTPQPVEEDEEDKDILMDEEYFDKLSEEDKKKINEEEKRKREEFRRKCKESWDTVREEVEERGRLFEEKKGGLRMVNQQRIREMDYYLHQLENQEKFME